MQSGPASQDPCSATGQELYGLAKSLIPGGTQLLSKRPEMYAPDQWPAYYREAQGCEVVDLDGRRYVDMSIMAVGTCLLGYNDPDVTKAVVSRVQAGSMCTLNNPEEVELARLLLQLHPWAEQVRYARTGGEAMAVAVRIARAATQRNRIAFCGYHGWHDWYLAANLGSSADSDRLDGHLLPGLKPLGVPTQLSETAFPFRYNDLEALTAITSQHGDGLAAVVMEPTRHVDPEPGFLEGVRELCDRTGAVMVFDEITAGWRFTLGGAHLNYGVVPDMAVFAKALGNGHPAAAIIGRETVMQAAQESFISSTYWTEGVGAAAALATLRKMQTVDVPSHIESIGRRFQDGLCEVARQKGVPLTTHGHPALTTIQFDHPQAAALGTLLTVRMLDHDILAGGAFYPTLAHTDRHVDLYLAAAKGILSELAEAIEQDNIESRIGGPIRHSGFARLT
jgi:glutamate-1-semialdehyde 2,1-aminomutase